MRPIIEAHRGDSSNAPENTMAAFQRAVDLGTPWLELDVHPSRDGRMVVIHDPTVDRTTNGSGRVADQTFDELRRLDAGAWFDQAFAGEKIPLLEEVMELLRPTATLLNIEIKSAPPGHDVPAAVTDILRRFGKSRQYLVSSFDLDALLGVRAAAPEIALAYTVKDRALLETARQHQFQFIHLKSTITDAGLVARAHAGGLKVNIWTVDDIGSIEHWRSVGVDKICTNRPGDMMAAARREP